ncbi:CaiB/BaiF CoA-transferase family protein [Mycolicibacterium grossiae]|uniref:CoA transferase n=1 Tax=Mycolicibacterium grossiae TaxID=1552759 RepID=A0A1E8Q4R6_9MYCO|nr:CoA transferase [Mycolicibacterium grossiae]OFJ53618.1 CoA transferase [Mycolicibacterium grossiae]QEM46745.1 CoA transferase [Mycolicibacterium grossiae]
MLDARQLLAPLRVLDVGGLASDGVGRLFAELGADVLKVEPPGGSADRARAPRVGDVGISFALRNAGKRCTTLDASLDADRARFAELIAGSDVVVDVGRPGTCAAFGAPLTEFARRHEHLVAVSLTDFGADGPRAGWQASDAVLYAMSTALSRSGPSTGRPVLPPPGLASATAATQAAWAALVAYYQRLRTGRGDVVDVSRFEAVLQSLDPPFGSEGQAAVGLRSAAQLWRGRPRNQQIFPTFACRDGYVRMCLLSARQWRGMRAWLGEPEEFADPALDAIAARYAASDRLNAAIADLFADRRADDLVAEGHARGVPIAAVLTPAQALATEHFRAAGALTAVDLAGVRLDVPVGAVVVDGVHAGPRRLALPVADDPPEWLPRAGTFEVPRAASSSRPFSGLRILDLGVIVAGGELGRLFADLGADVVKVESTAYPDGLRQTRPGQAMSRSWALTHRNERSLGLDLRHPDGAALFRRLLATADALFANFRPGTLNALGLSPEELRAVNPRLVLAESSAFGADGPWSSRMGYGPLVRATTGVSRSWIDRQPYADDVAEGFFDATTIFPDHLAARVTAIGALAALLARTDAAARVHVSQAEVAVGALATSFVADAAGVAASGTRTMADTDLDVVLPCAGDDEWCVASVATDAHRSALARLLGLDVRCAESTPAESTLVEALRRWAARRDPEAACTALQEAGVPAGPMLRAADVPADPQVLARRVYAEMAHPLFAEPLPAETRPARFGRIADAELRPAPMPGEHTREICAELGMTGAQIDHLLDTDVAFAWSAATTPERLAP